MGKNRLLGGAGGKQSTMRHYVDFHNSDWKKNGYGDGKLDAENLELYLKDTEAAMQCLECGRYYKKLCIHLVASHQMSSNDYRFKYGIPNSISLVSQVTSQRQSASSVEMWQDEDFKTKTIQARHRHYEQHSVKMNELVEVGCKHCNKKIISKKIALITRQQTCQDCAKKNKKIKSSVKSEVKCSVCKNIYLILTSCLKKALKKSLKTGIKHEHICKPCAVNKMRLKRLEKYKDINNEN